MVRGCFKRLALLLLLGVVGVSARSAGDALPCTADNGSHGYWSKECSNMMEAVSAVKCTCIPTVPKAPSYMSCNAEDGSRGFWPTGCEHMGIQPRFGCSCVKLAECRSNTHYCVYKEDCSVPTYRMRSDNCPVKDLECCPKPSTKEQITPYIGDFPVISPTEATTRAYGTTTDNNVTDRESEMSTKPGVVVTKSPETMVTPGISEQYPTTEPDDEIEGSATSPTDIPLPDSITTTTAYAVEKPSRSLTDDELSASTTAQTIDPVEKPLPSDNQTNVPPSVQVNTTIPASNITASDIAPLSENFVYRDCGQRAKDGLVPQKIRDQPDRAEYGEIPWMAAIFQIPINDDGSGSIRYCCNGALISNSAVLTTAHCISVCGGKVEQMLVRLGEWDLHSAIEPIPPKDVLVRKAYKHKDFAIRSLINNIAVLELDSLVQYGPTIQPVCLPEKDYPSLTSRENLIFTGWGRTVNPTPSSNGHNFLKSIILRNNDRSICKAEMKSYDSSHPLELHPSFVCGTKVHEEQPCRGDAGAPVVAEVPYSEERYYIHGLVSWGYECSRPDRPNTALTNVRGFRVWINKTLKDIANSDSGDAVFR